MLRALYNVFKPSQNSVLTQYRKMISHYDLDGAIGYVNKYPEYFRTYKDDDGYTPLMWECMYGRLQVVTALVSVGVDLNIRDKKGVTALQHAFSFPTGSGEAIGRLLLQYGANVDAKDDTGKTLLMNIMTWTNLKAEHRHKIVDLLTEFKADPNITDINGDTVLSLSYMNKLYDITTCLMMRGYDLNKFDSRGNTVLTHMITQQQEKFVMQLLKRKDVDSSQPDRYGLTPFMLACEYQLESVALVLMDKNADFDLRCVCGLDAVQIINKLIEKKIDMNQLIAGKTLLIYACANCAVNVAARLIDCGVDVNIRDKYGRTAISYASLYGLDKIMLQLIEHNADVNIVNEYGDTILYDVCRHGHNISTECFTKLVAGTKNINTVDYYGYTPLMYICMNGKIEHITKLIASGADMNLLNRHGTTALILACRYQCTDIAHYLIDNGADITADNYVALDMAHKNGMTEIYKKLVEKTRGIINNDKKHDDKKHDDKKCDDKKHDDEKHYKKDIKPAPIKSDERGVDQISDYDINLQYDQVINGISHSATDMNAKKQQ